MIIWQPEQNKAKKVTTIGERKPKSIWSFCNITTYCKGVYHFFEWRKREQKISGYWQKPLPSPPPPCEPFFHTASLTPKHRSINQPVSHTEGNEIKGGIFSTIFSLSLPPKKPGFWRHFSSLFCKVHFYQSRTNGSQMGQDLRVYSNLER